MAFPLNFHSNPMKLGLSLSAFTDTKTKPVATEYQLMTESGFKPSATNEAICFIIGWARIPRLCDPIKHKYKHGKLSYSRDSLADMSWVHGKLGEVDAVQKSDLGGTILIPEAAPAFSPSPKGIHSHQPGLGPTEGGLGKDPHPRAERSWSGAGGAGRAAGGGSRSSSGRTVTQHGGPPTSPSAPGKARAAVAPGALPDAVGGRRCARGAESEGAAGRRDTEGNGHTRETGGGAGRGDQAEGQGGLRRRRAARARPGPRTAGGGAAGRLARPLLSWEGSQGSLDKM